MSITVLTPVGCIGNRGVDRAALMDAMERHTPDVIAVDAGSLDCGPWYLGAGKAHSPYVNIRWDIECILDAAIPRGVPVIVGSAGGSGGDAHVDATVELVQRVADERGYHFKLAAIKSQVDKDQLLRRCTDGVLPGAFSASTGEPLSQGAVARSEVIVGAMGVEPIIDALSDGAQVIVAGRAVDSAVIAAYPIYRGCNRGLAYHMGDIMECAEATAEELRPVLRSLGHNRIPILGTIDESGFELRPAHSDMACTPQSCLMHSFYERTAIDSFSVPGCKILRDGSRYEAKDERTTRIIGTRYVNQPYSILFEGVERLGYRALFPFGVRTPAMVEQLPEILESMEAVVHEMFDPLGCFQIHWQRYGMDAVLGSAEMNLTPPHEVGVIADVVADTPELAHDVAYDMLTRVAFWRYPGRYTTAGNVAITFSPGIFFGGPVYGFTLYHVIPISDYREIVRTSMIDI